MCHAELGGGHASPPHDCDLFFFFFTLVTGPRRSLSLKLSDTKVYEPQIRARLGNHNTTILVIGSKLVCPTVPNIQAPHTQNIPKHGAVNMGAVPGARRVMLCGALLTGRAVDVLTLRTC